MRFGETPPSPSKLWKSASEPPLPTTPTGKFVWGGELEDGLMAMVEGEKRESSLTPAREAKADGESARPSGAAVAAASESQLVPIGAESSCEFRSGIDENDEGGSSEDDWEEDEDNRDDPANGDPAAAEAEEGDDDEDVIEETDDEPERCGGGGCAGSGFGF